jgi:hypothetical protein
LIIPSKSTTLSSSIAGSRTVAQTEYQNDNERRRAVVFTPLLRQWLKYFDFELRPFIDMTSNSDKLFLKQDEKPTEPSSDTNTGPSEMKFVSKNSVELLLTACYRYKAFTDTSSVNDIDLMDNFIDNYWGLFDYNEVYLRTWQSSAQSVLVKLDRKGDEYFAQVLEAFEVKVAEQSVSEEVVVTQVIHEAQIRKIIQQKLKDEALNDVLPLIDTHKQWSFLIKHLATLVSKNAPATIQALIARSEDMSPILVLGNLDGTHRLEYLQRLLKEFKIHRRSAALVHAVLKELLVQHPINHGQLFNEHKGFNVDAHKVEWGNSYSLMKILSQPNKYRFDPQTAEDLTRQHGFIKGLKLMLLNNKKYYELISLIVELDDLDEFENILQRNPATATPASWTHLIRTVLLDGTNAESTVPARRINFLFVAYRAITALGPRTAMTVLQACLQDLGDHAKHAQLPPSFFSAVLIETRAEVWAKLPIVRESLEVLDSHLWSVRSAALGAPFAEVFNHEVDSQVNDLDVDLPFVAPGPNVSPNSLTCCDRC